VPAVALVDVLDDLLAATGLDVDVDVRRAVALGREEPLEQQPEGDGVGLGDAEGEAHRRVGGRAPALAVDVPGAAELDDVPDDEEVAGEPELVDHGELVVDLGPRPGDPFGVARPVAALGALFGEPTQEPHLVEAVGARVGRQLGGNEVEVEGARPAQLGGPLDHAGVASEAAGLLGPGPQVGAGRGGQPSVELVEAAPGPHRGEGRGERPLGRRRVVGVGGGDGVDAEAQGDLGEGVVAGRVERVPVVPQLDGDVVAAEGLGQPDQLGGRGAGPVGLEGGRHRPLATTREHQPVALVGGRGVGAAQCGQLGERFARSPLLPPQLGLAHGPGEQGVAARVTGDDDEVGLPRARPRIGIADRHRRAPEGELGPEDGGHPELTSGLGEAHDAVEPVVVGEGQGLQAEPGRLLHQHLG
jgi:hypothetical protein